MNRTLNSFVTVAVGIAVCLLLISRFGHVQAGQISNPAGAFVSTGQATWTNGSDTTYINNQGGTGYDVATVYLNAAQITDANIIGANIFATKLGTAVASASTITITNGLTHVTGTTAIATITPPVPYHDAAYAGCVDFIADAAWTTVTTGNIANAITAVANTPYHACYDGTKWYIK